VDIGEYERLLEEVERLRDVRVAERQLAAGDVLSQEEAREEVRRHLLGRSEIEP
jgi:hypothetical protein